MNRFCLPESVQHDAYTMACSGHILYSLCFLLMNLSYLPVNVEHHDYIMYCGVIVQCGMDEIQKPQGT
jgi:hypothetical protein